MITFEKLRVTKLRVAVSRPNGSAGRVSGKKLTGILFYQKLLESWTALCINHES